MKPVARAFATGLALGVMALTLAAHAEPPPAVAAPSPSTTEAEPGTPLSLRAGKPLELAREPARTSWGWKVVAVLSVLGGAAFYWRKRRPGATAEAAPLFVVHRVSVGIRSELLVVNVEGQRLLIGVTPQSIQSLAILDAGEGRGDEAAADAPPSLGERVQAMLDSAEKRRPLEDALAEDEETGQARGLLSLRGRR